MEALEEAGKEESIEVILSAKLNGQSWLRGKIVDEMGAVNVDGHARRYDCNNGFLCGISRVDTLFAETHSK